jgi:type II secretion system protein G
MRKTTSGFTIVELLIVIVIIGILAAITIIAYNGMQQRARDTRRASDASNIVKALESYHIVHGNFPTATANPGVGGFEVSTDQQGSFMEYLQGDYFNQVPLDPINNSSHQYRYYLYDAAQLAAYGCPTDKGSLMVFYAIGFEVYGNAPKGSDPLVCTNRTWTGDALTYFYYNFG